MTLRCICFSRPVTLGEFFLASSLRGVVAACKQSHSRTLSRTTTPPGPQWNNAAKSRHGNWQARRYQHGVPPSTHSSPIRPKQSLGQNFLKDRNVVSKIVHTFNEHYDRLCPTGSVIEVGAGTGALSSSLWRKHRDMLAVEIDGRAVEVLRSTHPNLQVLHTNVLELDWDALAAERGRPLAVVGNLPYNIVSQIMFSMFEARAGSLSFALVMMQKEVAERICARTRTKAYGILSIVGQLYTRPKLLFGVPNTAFYPKPSVTSAMVCFEFVPHPCIDVRDYVLTGALRKVLRAAFQQRRKTLRNSLRALCVEEEVQLGEEWAAKRPEEISPEEFVELTQHVYAKRLGEKSGSSDTSKAENASVWRPRKS